MKEHSLLNLPTEILQLIISFLIYESKSENWKELLSNDSCFYRPISIPLERMKQIVLSLQSVCSYFLKDYLPIGKKLNEFWLLVMQREFYYTKQVIESEREKMRWKSKRCYGLLKRMVEIKFNDACYPIGNIQKNNQDSYRFKACVIGENAGEEKLTKRYTNDDNNQNFDIEFMYLNDRGKFI